MTYTISPCLIEFDTIGTSISSILFIFSNKRNSYKVAKDKNNTVIDTYLSINTKYKDAIMTWLDLMANVKPDSFELVNVNIDNISDRNLQFIKLCKSTIGSNKMIVYSKQYFDKFEWKIDKILYENVYIEVFDKDEALEKLNQNNIKTEKTIQVGLGTFLKK